MTKIVGFGDNVVDCYSDRGVMFAGGNALNVAVFAHRFGARSSYVGAVADDAAGRHIRAALEAEGIDTAHLRTLPGRTAFCVIGQRDGEREFLRADLGVSIIAPEPGDLEHIAAHDAVHTGRSSHVDAHLPDFAARTRLSFDFAVLRDEARIAAIAPHCFLASFSGGALAGEEVERLGAATLQAGARWCLVTRGREGAALFGPGVARRVAAPQVRVIDTLGAGDTFIARTLVGLLREEPAEAILHAAAAAAGETCGRLGGLGPPAPIEIDESEAMTLEQIYGAGGGQHG